MKLNPIESHRPLLGPYTNHVGKARAFYSNRDRIESTLTPQKEPMTSPPTVALMPVLPLRLRDVATRLNVHLQELADAGSCGKSTMHAIVNRGAWPTRMVVLRDPILQLLRDRGATEDELKTVFQTIDPPAPKTEPAKAAAIDIEEPTMLMGKQSLNFTAREAFGLFKDPFTTVANEEEMFVSNEIRFVREACWSTASNGACVAIVGESGSGKSTLLGDFKERIASSNKLIRVIEPSVIGMEETDTQGKRLKVDDILAAGIWELAPDVALARTTQGRTKQFMKLLAASAEAGYQHMLLIEEAHSLPDATLRHLKRLNEASQIGRRPALGVLLLAHPELLKKLNPARADLREVYQRFEIVRLMPLDGDLRGYLEHRFKQVGKGIGELLTDDGIEEIRSRMTTERRIGNKVSHVSSLYPLAVNNLVIAALNTAAALGVPLVDKDVVRAV